MNPRAFVISGPSGVGKSTIIRHLLQRLPNVRLSVSMTTRPRREGEVDGRDYFFVSREEFQQRIARNEFLEYATIYDNLYGTHRAHIEDLLASGNHALLDVDTQGALQIKQRCQGAVYLFIKPPSRAALESRLRGRKTESEASFQKRMGRADHELTLEHEYQYAVINDDIATTVENLVAIITREATLPVPFVLPPSLPMEETAVVSALMETLDYERLLARLEHEIGSSLGIAVTDWIKQRMDNVLRRDLESIVRETYQELAR
jgi:guanylate kinase